MAESMGLVLAAIVCLTTPTKGAAQEAGAVSSVRVAFSVVQAPEAFVLKLGEAPRMQARHFAASRVVPQAQSSKGAPKHRAVKWGAGMGFIAGFTGGLLQPTHSNGEYVLGPDRITSSLVLGGIGAGVGALIGLAIEKSRK